MPRMFVLRRLVAILVLAVMTASAAAGAALAHSDAHAPRPAHAHEAAGAEDCAGAACRAQEAADHARDCATAAGHCQNLLLRGGPALPAAARKRSLPRWPSADMHLSGTSPEAQTPPPRS
ncbi:hypothetical protein [Oceanicella actignis]|uniref:hypothetical protein n=1 Tax=Oceanicella actignis TaxID=1189325 RepID=UPI0009327582|nr:hypothetical protein [Oceanicella actignis]